MKFRITWVHASLFALSAALSAVACDDPDAMTEEDLAVEALDEDVQDRAQGDAKALADETEELPDGLEERRWDDDDDDDHGRWDNDDHDRWDDDDDDDHGRRHHRRHHRRDW